MKAVSSVKKRSMKDISFVPFFVLSMFMTMILCIIYKSELLLQTDVLSQSMLSLVKISRGNKGSLFLYVLSERLWIIPLLFLFSTTYLGRAMAYISVMWFGVSMGTICSVAILRYGMTGFLLIILSLFPQYLLYIPVFVISIKLCGEERIPDKRFYMQFFVLEFVVIIGCLLETFLNSFFVEKIIKIFIGV